MDPPQSGKGQDRWADWLLRGRQRGLSAAQERRMAGRLRRIRDRVLRGGGSTAGARVLDVGAGTGLLALEARRRVGPSGLVVALDISHDALRECIRQAGDGEAAPLHAVRGDAVHLPLRDGFFDAVFTRSVLIYVSDKAGAVRELYRVLRPGGRASLFEPINRVESATAWGGGRDLAAVQPAHDRIVAYLQEGWEHRDTMLGFDERDLVSWFVEAGFRSVELAYELRYTSATPRAREVIAGLRLRPNPSLLSYEEAARAVLGDGADEHLGRYVRLLTSTAGRGMSAAAYLTARR